MNNDNDNDNDNDSDNDKDNNNDNDNDKTLLYRDLVESPVSLLHHIWREKPDPWKSWATLFKESGSRNKSGVEVWISEWGKNLGEVSVSIP